MSKMKLIPEISLVLLILILFLIWIIPSEIRNGACKKADLLYIKKMNNAVASKYIDYNNRSIGIVKFSTGKSLVLSPFTNEHDLFKYVDVGDTINNDKNSLIFTVSSPTKKSKSFKLYFSCDEYR